MTHRPLRARAVSGTLTVLWLLALVSPPPAGAQDKARRVELAGFAGLYVPTNDEGLELALREATRKGSVAWGGRLTLWATQTLGVEFSGAMSPARISVRSNAGRFPRNTDFYAGAGKLVLNLTPGSKLLGIQIGGGVAAVRFSKTVPDPESSKSYVGGIGGVAVRLRLGDGVALRGDAEDYFYGGNFGKGRKFTQDLLLSGGLAIAF